MSKFTLKCVVCHISSILFAKPEFMPLKMCWIMRIISHVNLAFCGMIFRHIFALFLLGFVMIFLLLLQWFYLLYLLLLYHVLLTLLFHVSCVT
jgi:hypothetical protein